MMAEVRRDRKTFLALDNGTTDKSIAQLVPILADTIFIYSLYKKYHWHVEGEDFYQYHLLFDKHAEEQLPLADLLAERIRTLGGVAPGMPNDVVNNATITEPADPKANGHAMIKNLCNVHGAMIAKLREAIELTDKIGDDGTNDMLVSDVLRLNELQLWFIRSSLR